jgi:hypothetical protein
MTDKQVKELKTRSNEQIIEGLKFQLQISNLQSQIRQQDTELDLMRSENLFLIRRIRKLISLVNAMEAKIKESQQTRHEPEGAEDNKQ